MLNKLTVLFLIGIVFVQAKTIAQCQLCYLNEKQAQRAFTFLKMTNEVVLFSGCENNDIARKLVIQKVEKRPADRKGYFEIYIKGSIIATFDIVDQKVDHYAKMNLQFEDVVDIAYVHIRTGGYSDPETGNNIWDANCLGIYLGYDCDPCVDPFDYPVYEDQ